METSDLLADAFARIHDGVRSVTSGIDPAALVHRPDPDANSIAWLIWHATRVQDDHLADLVGREQLWFSAGWAERFDLPYEPADTGYGHSSEQVAAMETADLALLTGYHEAVARQTEEDIDRIVETGLGRVVDERWDPPVTAGVRLVSVISDSLQHVGQAAYVRGLWERRDG